MTTQSIITHNECGHLRAFGDAALMARLHGLLSASRGDHYTLGTTDAVLRFSDVLTCEVCN